MILAERLKARRLELGLTTVDVARAVGVSRSTVGRWENGDIANMKDDKIKVLADALGVSPSYLMGWSDDKARSAEEHDLVRACEGLSPRMLSLMRHLPARAPFPWRGVSRMRSETPATTPSALRMPASFLFLAPPLGTLNNIYAY